MQKNNKIRMYALLPTMTSQEGHEYSYHQCISRITKKRKIIYIKFIPKNCFLKLSRDWKKKLFINSPSKHKNLRRNFLKPIVDSFIFFKLCHKLKKRNQCYILFGENFLLLEQVFFFLSVLFSFSKKAHVWILQRYETDMMFLQGKLHRILYKGLQSLLKERFRLFTDTELLAKQQEQFIKIPITLWPIPHTFQSRVTHQKEKTNKVFLWPGGSIREEKGLCTILHMEKLLRKSLFPIMFGISENARTMFEQNTNDATEKENFYNNIVWIKNNLSLKSYFSILNQADLVLLPYVTEQYRYRSSGIFIESIALGKMCAVTKGTWMAYEYTKFHITELIFAWNEENLIEKLYNLCQNQEIQRKIEKMQKHYLSFHTEKRFEKVFRQNLPAEFI